MSWVEALRRRWWTWTRGARIAPPSQLDDHDRRLLTEQYVVWPLLDDSERERMERLIGAFVTRMRWEAARGFELDHDTQVLIAAQACLLLLGLDLDEFPATSSVIVHPRTVMLRGARGTGIGSVQSSSPRPVHGQAHYRGPVLLSWSAVRNGLRWPERGNNVVYHEFAHQLDMLDGSVDGTPPLDDPAAMQRWIDVCTEAYDTLRDGDGSPVLRSYGGTNPGEFFAVATEAFFTQPVALRDHEPGLYAELRSYYGQDPARRLQHLDAADPTIDPTDDRLAT